MSWKKKFGKKKNLTRKIGKEIGTEENYRITGTLSQLLSHWSPGNFCMNCWERKIIRLIAKPIKVNLFVEK